MAGYKSAHWQNVKELGGSGLTLRMCCIIVGLMYNVSFNPPMSHQLTRGVFIRSNVRCWRKSGVLDSFTGLCFVKLPTLDGDVETWLVMTIVFSVFSI